MDHHYYGRWVSSVFNLLLYNVAGGGESYLYGTEGPLFYLRNGFNNFNFCFVLALLFLVIFPISRKRFSAELLVVVSPLYVWLCFMSLQPHKEERWDFIFYIYFKFCVRFVSDECYRSRWIADSSILYTRLSVLLPRLSLRAFLGFLKLNTKQVSMTLLLMWVSV